MTEVGKEVEGRFKIGNIVGVGCIVGSCGECACCKSDREQYCSKVVFTYNGIDVDGRPTTGGFASYMIVNHRLVIFFIWYFYYFVYFVYDYIFNRDH